jgi:pimeloyl-ACP methyl ester carboxylesterase
VELTNYGRFDLVRFLFPGSIFRKSVVDEIVRQIRGIRSLTGDARCSVVAHSFGTFIIASILRDHTDIEFQRIIFCGSVVRHWFRFEDYRSRFETPVVNEVGTKDVWPVLAATVTTGYGSAGTYGFRRPRVRDRWHNGKTHSAFLEPKFCLDFWVPFLRDGTIVEGDGEPESPPWWLQVVAVLQPRYLVALAVLAAVWWWVRPFRPL